jgi:hypothetical protein
MAEYFDGSSEFNITQNRDVYELFDNENCLFFLNYDKEQKLQEIEIRNNVVFKIGASVFSLNSPLDQVILEMQTFSGKMIQIEEGGYLFIDLGIVFWCEDFFANSSPRLDYIYCSRDVSHLIKGNDII